MPIYQYQCQICGREVEGYFHLSDPHPTCCVSSMQRLISPCSYHIKGTFTRTQKEIRTDVDLAKVTDSLGSCPVFESPEHRAKSEWAVKKARMGDFDLTV